MSSYKVPESMTKRDKGDELGAPKVASLRPKEQYVGDVKGQLPKNKGVVSLSTTEYGK